MIEVLWLGLVAVVVILALAYDNRDHHHIWREDDKR